MNAMKLKPIGKSGLITSNLTLGTMIFGEESDRSTPEKEALKLIDRYLDAGGNHLDTADGYAAGMSERIVGKAIQSRRSEVLVSTKLRFPNGDHPNRVGLSRWNIMEGVNASLTRLNTDYIDLLYLHCWDPITPLEETLHALDTVIQQGKVRYIGISNFKAWQLMKTQGLCDHFGMDRFIAGQYQYSLVKRDMEYEFFDLMEAEGLGLLPWGPLGGGFLTGKYSRGKQGEGRIASSSAEHEESWERRDSEQNWRVLDAVQDIAKSHQATPTQISIAWILSKPLVSSVIIGVRTMEQLEDNLNANQVVLSENEVSTLNEVSALPELYPYRMIEAYGSRNY